MSNFALARALTTGVTVAALTTGILTVSVAAYAHGTGGQTGGGGPKGMATMTTGKMTTTKTMDHNNRWRRLELATRVMWARHMVASTSERPGVRQGSVAISTDHRARQRTASTEGRAQDGPPFGLRAMDRRTRSEHGRVADRATSIDAFYSFRCRRAALIRFMRQSDTMPWIGSGDEPDRAEASCGILLLS